MLDQGFNARNFRRIYDVENRRGHDLERRFELKSGQFARLREMTLNIKRLKVELREKLKIFQDNKNDFIIEEINDCNSRIESALVEKDCFLTTVLDGIEATAQKNTLNISLKRIDRQNHKSLYITEDNPLTFFIEKQLQRNLSQLYKLTPSNRDHLIPQIAAFCQGDLPIWGVRTDISGFYEAIDHDILLKQIKEDQRLDAPSVRYVKQLLYSYRIESDGQTGLPRGNGISAYLSELYMRKVDKQIRSIPNLVFYGRYVDDIIALFVQTPDSTMDNYIDKIRNIISSENLELNEEKTVPFDNKKPSCRFIYLGYEFILQNGSVSIDITHSKLEKIRSRVTKSFDRYLDYRGRDENKNRRQFENRIRFLTSNTRLFNNKSNAYVGVYYSNRYVTDPIRFKGLDRFLENQIRRITSERLKCRLGKHSFLKGFREQTYYHFTETELADIVGIWKYE